MARSKKHVSMLGLTLCIALLVPASAWAQEPVRDEPVHVVERLMEAFNAHDVEAMIALVTDDVELYYPDEGGTFAPASRSAAQLATDMRAYFAANPSVQSRLEAVVPGPVFVSIRERIVGGQSSLAVCEVRQGLVRRVWYFPAEDSGAG
jgi:hypothetical protein